mmetsp:Transcript_98759/g.268196  ORF Transcript_98759/g.268196 Transcript_98759/m.268196 type:complete len:200 (-) Transcript_98759:3-602(-)
MRRVHSQSVVVVLLSLHLLVHVPRGQAQTDNDQNTDNDAHVGERTVLSEHASHKRARRLRVRNPAINLVAVLDVHLRPQPAGAGLGGVVLHLDGVAQGRVLAQVHALLQGHRLRSRVGLRHHGAASAAKAIDTWPPFPIPVAAEGLRPGRVGLPRHERHVFGSLPRRSAPAEQAASAAPRGVGGEPRPRGPAAPYLGLS